MRGTNRGWTSEINFILSSKYNNKNYLRNRILNSHRFKLKIQDFFSSMIWIWKNSKRGFLIKITNKAICTKTSNFKSMNMSHLNNFFSKKINKIILNKELKKRLKIPKRRKIKMIYQNNFSNLSKGGNLMIKINHQSPN